jgi:hypothetical protein
MCFINGKGVVMASARGPARRIDTRRTGTLYARAVSQAREYLSAGRRYAEENGIGLAVSFLLHGAAAFLVLFAVAHSSFKTAPPTTPLVPVDLIRLGDETRSPPAERQAVVPQQRAGKTVEEASPTREAVSPTGRKQAPVDALDAKLRDLARLKQPDSQLKIGGQGVSNVDAANGEPGDSATYSIRDYVLAQVLRRWTLNLSRSAERPIVVPIRVAMKRDGTITLAQIVEEGRAKTDVIYRDIAIGARNAVLLSSPIALPAGDYPKEMHFTLLMDTRAVLR